MAAETDISNYALGHLGIGKTIASMTEPSTEARTCSLFLPIARDMALTDFIWPFARRFKALALVMEQPITEWQFSYRYPSDCLVIRNLRSGLWRDSRQTEVPYIIASDDAGQLIYTNFENAEIEYTKRIDDTTKFTSEFKMALSYLLAGLIAPSISRGDPSGMQTKMLQLYQVFLTKAGVTAANQDQSYEAVESEFIRVREGRSDFEDGSCTTRGVW